MKYYRPEGKIYTAGRSRKGAWIEIFQVPSAHRYLIRSRKGAWIEMPSNTPKPLNMMFRSRKGAWIEIKSNPIYGASDTSLP